MTAEALQQRFALAFKGEARQLFLDLAQLLPSQLQRAQLLSAAAAAGWLQPSADAADAAEPDEQAAVGQPQETEGLSTAQQEDGTAWQPLDRSRIAAAASALAGDAAQVHAEGCSTSSKSQTTDWSAGMGCDVHESAASSCGMQMNGSSAAADRSSAAVGTSGRGSGEPELPPGVDDHGPQPAKRARRCSALIHASFHGHINAAYELEWQGCAGRWCRKP